MANLIPALAIFTSLSFNSFPVPSHPGSEKTVNPISVRDCEVQWGQWRTVRDRVPRYPNNSWTDEARRRRLTRGVMETESYRVCDGRQHLFLPLEIIVLDIPTFALPLSPQCNLHNTFISCPCPWLTKIGRINLMFRNRWWLSSIAQWGNILLCAIYFKGGVLCRSGLSFAIGVVPERRHLHFFASFLSTPLP